MNEGEVIGIIGRNGAGGSTLLKILSRITTPTRSEAILNGRVGSLLDVSRAGRTVLFVSHNLNAVMQLCSRTLWIERGTLKEDSKNVQGICSKYLLGDGEKLRGSYSTDEQEALDCEYFSLKNFRLADLSSTTINHPIQGGDSFNVEISVHIKKLSPLLNFGCAVIDEYGQHILWTVTTDKSKEEWPDLKLGDNKLSVEIPGHLLNEGQYTVDFFASLHGQGWFSEVGNTHVNVILMYLVDLVNRHIGERADQV